MPHRPRGFKETEAHLGSSVSRSLWSASRARCRRVLIAAGESPRTLDASSRSRRTRTVRYRSDSLGGWRCHTRSSISAWIWTTGRSLGDCRADFRGIAHYEGSELLHLRFSSHQASDRITPPSTLWSVLSAFQPRGTRWWVFRAFARKNSSHSRRTPTSGVRTLNISCRW